MTSNFIDCPDGGKCGHRKRQIGSDAYAGAISNPVKLSGSYNIDIGSSDNGVESGIMDDMTRKYGQFFYYSGNSVLNSLSSKTVKY